MQSLKNDSLAKTSPEVQFSEIEINLKSRTKGGFSWWRHELANFGYNGSLEKRFLPLKLKICVLIGYSESRNVSSLIMGFGELSVDQHEFVVLLPECFPRRQEFVEMQTNYCF